MAKNLREGDTVLVPTSLLPNSNQYGTVLTRRRILEMQDRKARVDLKDGSASDLLPKSKLHKNLGILVLRIGDFDTEATLLDPLAKSILHFARLFLDDSFARLLQVRSVAELTAWLPPNVAAFSHLVVVGHCNGAALKLGVDGFVQPVGLASICGTPPQSKVTVISLACESGKDTFAQGFSQLPFCEALIAPFQTLHGAIASQYCQSFFARLLVQGQSTAVAHRNARDATPGSTSFELWKNGKMM
jgi:hypothetical protein